ncbi:hypothetical protein [Xanthomarina sp. GH4-25]|uniref:hypothetical protein n=1 Tax=Xanthomarina sp. GH4-25 TaxID=3349335 RepID=UPI000D6792F9|nr:hypothetical protein DI383_05095 [Flavobacteriaceae bacterium LYZ1037]
MREAEFLSYNDGFYTFMFENGEELIFDEIHPRVLKQFDLKNDETFINKSFKITFIEVSQNNDEDFVIYRVESLKPL